MSGGDENQINQFLSDTNFNSDSSFFTNNIDNDSSFLPGDCQNTSSPNSSTSDFSIPSPNLIGTSQNQIDYSNNENSLTTHLAIKK